MRLLTLDQVLACPKLPTLPRVAVDVLDLTRDPDVSLSDLAAVVQYDQALCGKILRTVNSCYFRLSSPCTTMPRAIAYLGLKTVRALVLNFSLVDVSRHTARRGFDLLDYWRRCIFSAAAARSVARLTASCDPEEASLGALFQDIGMLAVHSAAPEAYIRVVASTRGDHRVLTHHELRELGFTHAAVGARLGERWHLPAQLIEPIRHHHDGGAGTGARYGHLVNTVRLGFHLATFFAFEGGRSELNRIYTLADRDFNLSRSDLRTLITESAATARDLADLLSLEIGDHPNIEALLTFAEDARIDHTLAMRRDAVHLEERNRSLARQALTDALTGIGNRRCFDIELHAVLQKARFEGRIAGLVMIDVDNFKSLNDRFGHQVGDAVLTELARRFCEHVGEDGLVCRYGGEEFAVLLPGAGRRQTAIMAEGLRRAAARRPVSVDRVSRRTDDIPVTISLGAVAYEPSITTDEGHPEHLVAAADRALYAAKAAGRDCVRVYRPRPAARAG